MKTNEYILLEKLLEKNRRLFKKDIIELDEYIENHELIMAKLKLAIFEIEKADVNFLKNMDIDETKERFRKEIFIIKFNLN